jgi:hypothetical protein
MQLSAFNKQESAAEPAFRTPCSFTIGSVVCTAVLADYLRFPRPQSLLENYCGSRRKMCFHGSVLLLRNLGFVTPTGPASVSDRVRGSEAALSLDRT